MADWSDSWLAIYNALFTETKKVAGLDETNVFQGLDRTPIGDPLVLIGAGDVAEDAVDTGGTYYRMDFIFVIIVEEPDLTAGLKETFDWAGLIWQEIKDDRELGGNADRVEDPSYRPNGLATLPGFERQHLVMTVRTYVWVND